MVRNQNTFSSASPRSREPIQKQRVAVVPTAGASSAPVGRKPRLASGSQFLSVNLLGLLEYGLGGLGLFLFARLFWPLPTWRSLALIMAGLGVVVWFALGMMGDPQQAEWRGGWQRLAEISLFGGMLWIVRQAGQKSRTI